MARDSRAELVRTVAQLMRAKGYTATGRAELLAKSPKEYFTDISRDGVGSHQPRVCMP